MRTRRTGTNRGRVDGYTGAMQDAPSFVDLMRRWENAGGVRSAKIIARSPSLSIAATAVRRLTDSCRLIPRSRTSWRAA